jgi:hypothetical protein
VETVGVANLLDTQMALVEADEGIADHPARSKPPGGC